MKLDDLWVFLAMDHSQIEIRMLAEASQDKLLLSQFRKKLDIHCVVGSTLGVASFEQVKSDKKIRTFVKNCHFGMVYGLDEEGLYYYLIAKGVETTKAKVAKFHRQYFRTYKGVARFIRKMQDFAAEHHFVETMFGFRRRIGVEEARKTKAENQAVNSPIQGAAHTLVLIALALLSEKPKTFNLLQKPVLEVHDAIVFRVRLGDLKEAYLQAKQLMEQATPRYVAQWFGFDLKVPLLCEAEAGFRYGVLVEYNGGGRDEFLAAWRAKNKDFEAHSTMAA